MRRKKRRGRTSGYEPIAVFDSDLPCGIERMARARYESGRKEEAPSWEQLTEEQNRKLQEWEYERMLRDGRCGLQYLTKTTKYANRATGKQYVEVEIEPVFTDRVMRQRARKKAKTKEAQRKANDRRARKKLERLININFTERDLWCTFGWDGEHMPAGREEAQKDVSKFFREINKIRKRRGYENARYIYLLAFDAYTRKHVHIVMSGDCMNRDEVEDCWTKCRRKNTRRLDPDKDSGLAGLAAYITKNPHGTKRWQPSRNLDHIPNSTVSASKFSKRKVAKMAFNRAEAEVEIQKAYPGFRLTDLQVTWNDVNAAFYIRAKMTRD